MLADLPRDMSETVFAALDMIASQIVDDAVTDGATRRDVIADRGGMAAVRVDALLSMAERALSAAPAAAERGDIGGRRVAPEIARRWACDIRASVALEHDGHPADCGRDTRTVNRRLRRALHRRDNGLCRFPGCGASSWLHAHHVVHWEDGGPTDLDNLVSLCGFHHHLVHEGGWSVAIADRAIVWSDPGGTPATVEPLRGSGDPVERRGRERGIHAESITSIWHDDRLDFGFVVSVIVEHCRRVGAGSAGVPAGTSTPRTAGGRSSARRH